MKPFIQIAQPHQDILEGRLTMDVFAADLWQVVQGQAPLDYKDKDLFLKKTYITKGLQEILNVAKSRLEGKSGDSVIIYFPSSFLTILRTILIIALSAI